MIRGEKEENRKIKLENLRTKLGLLKSPERLKGIDLTIKKI